MAATDISPTALAIGATAQLPGDDITWVATDLTVRQLATTYDLVTSSFLSSEVDLPRESIFRRAATSVAPAGMLLIVGHSGAPRESHPPDVGQAHPPHGRTRRTGCQSPGRCPRPTVDGVEGSRNYDDRRPDSATGRARRLGAHRSRCE